MQILYRGGDLIKGPQNDEIKYVLKLVADPGFSFMTLELDKGYAITITRNTLYMTLYWLEMKQLIYRKTNIKRGQKKYFLTQYGEELMGNVEMLEKMLDNLQLE